MQAKMDYDQSLKRLLLRAHEGFLALVAPDLAWRGELSPELPAVKRQADLVWEVEQGNGERGVLHVELQTRPNNDIGERVAEYGIRLWIRDHRPVCSLVVFLRPAATIPSSPLVLSWAGQEYLRYTYGVIRLWEIPPERVLETSYYELWPLAGLMGDVTVESTLTVAEQIATAPLPAKERDELTKTLVLLAGLRLPRQWLRDAPWRKQMIEDIWEQSSLAGVLEDIAMQRLTKAAIEARFGPLTEEMLEALRHADENICTAIVTHIATDTLEQVRARLGLS